jgi:hypothetical protein
MVTIGWKQLLLLVEIDHSQTKTRPHRLAEPSIARLPTSSSPCRSLTKCRHGVALVSGLAPINAELFVPRNAFAERGYAQKYVGATREMQQAQ